MTSPARTAPPPVVEGPSGTSRNRRTRQTRGRLSAPVRRAVLLLHIVAGVGWLGVAAVTFVLTVAALTETDAAVLRAAYGVHELLIGTLARPAALTTLGTGLVLSVGTKWGIAGYYWPLVKLVFTVVTIVLAANLTPGWIAIALDGADTPLSSELTTVQVHLLGMAVFHILILGAATWLSVYKPGGRTPWNRPAARSPR